MDGIRFHTSHTFSGIHILCVGDFVEILDFDGDASRNQNFTMFIKTLKMNSTDRSIENPKIIEKD